MSRINMVFLAAVCALASACRQDVSSPPTTVTNPQVEASTQAKGAIAQNEEHADTKGDVYSFPTAEEMSPLRPEYLAELARIHEPPEMAGKPMQVRKALSPNVQEIVRITSAIPAPEKATHEQRVESIRELLEIVSKKEQDDGVDIGITYGAIAIMACLDGAPPQEIIGYANKAIGDGGDSLALRARMYLKVGDREKALGDLEKIMVDNSGKALVGGDDRPRSQTSPCAWSLADLDALGNDPRALAAKGMYLSSFIAYGAEEDGVVKEAYIRELYARASKSWKSAIPDYLAAATLYGFGSEHSMRGARCIRVNSGGTWVDVIKSCAERDEGTRQRIRELTMAIISEPAFAAALSERAGSYLELAQASYADNKPSRKLYELAIDDFTAAISAGAKNLNALYCDRAIAQASIGRYKDAAFGYTQCMKYATNGVEDSPFVYEQLAGLYMKLGKFSEAAELITQAIMNVSGGGMDLVIAGGGIKAFRKLYPEYDLVPDEILAEAVRRRYQPQSPKSWDADFISKGGFSNGMIISTILSELYVIRGDAYMKLGRRADALADYRRVKSDVWSGEEQFLPKNIYFNKRGNRNYDNPEVWPPLPPKL